MVRRRSSRQFLVARSRCTKFRDAKYFIPDEICTAIWRRSDRLKWRSRKRFEVVRIKSALTRSFRNLTVDCFHVWPVRTVCMVNLTEGMLLACVRVLSISRCDRNMLRSPFSMYSVTMHSGSDDTHTHSSRMMLGSFRRDIIFISFRKSFLIDGQIKERKHFQICLQVSISQCYSEAWCTDLICSRTSLEALTPVYPNIFSSTESSTALTSNNSLVKTNMVGGLSLQKLVNQEMPFGAFSPARYSFD